MKNWLEYIENELIDIDFDDIETKQTDYYLYKFYRLNGTYLAVDLIDDFRKIRKIEIGKYWLTNSNVWGYEVSSAKAVLDKTKMQFIDFLQVSFDSEYGEQYELDFTTNNQRILSQFLNVPLFKGWIENYYNYKEDNYKICIELETDIKRLNFEIILLHFAEQDIPLPGDKTERRIRAWWADLKINDTKRKIEREIIKPLKIKTLPYKK
ncbi:hypothetical protein DNU06_17235 [Putridiphycobacter roseus]|uniref:Uncharacterized protein n=1 Tax=Putridiphycobacter roseus TaxID=2219161 RepID=A0A2W1NJ00_9FLAO|nr:hypothetical protein [Putridiphycobacter roseus]PZE15602.1 hypothetical protein DNU06_17235 [Putridiphycobacter roseus]